MKHGFIMRYIESNMHVWHEWSTWGNSNGIYRIAMMRKKEKWIGDLSSAIAVMVDAIGGKILVVVVQTI